MVNQWKWYVYILETADGLYYTGVTWDIAKRMEQHKSGKGSVFTGKHGFCRLCYTEEYMNINDARAREIQVKDGTVNCIV